MNKFAVIAKESLALFIADLVYRAANVVVVWLIARQLGPRDTGLYIFGNGFRMVFQLIAFSGTGYLLIRELSQRERDNQSYFNTFTLMRCGLSVLAWLLLGLAVRFTGLISLDAVAVILVMGIEILPESIREIARARCIAQQQTLPYALVASIFGGARVVVGWWILREGRGLLGIVASGVLISLVGNTLLLLIIHSIQRNNFHGRISFKLMKEQFLASFPLWIINVLLVVYSQLNVFLLAFLRGKEEVGFYGTPDSIVAASSLFTQVYMSIALPHFAQLHISNQQHKLQILYNKSLLILLSTALPIALGITLQAEAITSFWGEQFLTAPPVIGVLIWSVVLSWLNAPNSCVMLATRNEAISARYLVVSLLTNILAGLFLIPRHGALGAAFARIIAEVAFDILHLIFVYKNIVRISLRVLVGPIIAALAMGLTGSLLQTVIAPLMAATLSYTVYAVVLFSLNVSAVRSYLATIF